MRIISADTFTFHEGHSLFITGATRSGKSYLVHKLIDQLKSALAFEEVKFALFDLKRVEFTDFDKDYLYFDVVNDLDEGLDRLDELAELSLKRTKAATKKPMIFIYIEECDIAYVDQKRFDKAVISINQNAKKASMKLIYSTSRLEHASVSEDLLASFDLILAGQLADNQHAKLFGIPYSDKLERFAFVLSRHDDLYDSDGKKYKMMDISKIDISFGGNKEPHDEHLTKLLQKAYKQEIDCHRAVIPMDLIEPFSDFMPNVSDSYVEKFLEAYKAMSPPDLYVYEKNGKFIMSDDYNAYHMYKAIEAVHAICTVIGDTTITKGVEYGPAFKLQMPQIQTSE